MWIVEKSKPWSLEKVGNTTAYNTTENDIKAICTNCNKQFKSMRAVTMHLKMTGARHPVTFINHGNYDKNTGLRDIQFRVQ